MKQAEKFQVSKAWKLIITDLGLSPASVLVFSELPKDLFSRKGAMLTAEEYFRLWRGLESAADKAFGVAGLPVRIGRSISSNFFDPPIFASLCSPNFLIAVERLKIFKRLIGPMHLDITEENDQITITITCYGVKDDLPYSLAASEAVFFTQIARIATRHPIKPAHITFANAPDDTTEISGFTGAEIRKGRQLSITFDKHDTLRPFLTEDAGMWEFFEPNLRQRLHDLDRNAKMSIRVKSALLEMLPSGQSSMEEISNRLAMSKRNIQRKLKIEENSFQSILQHVRLDLARHYLSNSDLSHSEISFLLGFHDTNSFIRAYTTWTGESPGKFRNSIHQEEFTDPQILCTRSDIYD